MAAGNIMGYYYRESGYESYILYEYDNTKYLTNGLVKWNTNLENRLAALKENDIRIDAAHVYGRYLKAFPYGEMQRINLAIKEPGERACLADGSKNTYAIAVRKLFDYENTGIIPEHAKLLKGKMGLNEIFASGMLNGLVKGAAFEAMYNLGHDNEVILELLWEFGSHTYYTYEAEELAENSREDADIHLQCCYKERWYNMRKLTTEEPDGRICLSDQKGGYADTLAAEKLFEYEKTGLIPSEINVMKKKLVNSMYQAGELNSLIKGAVRTTMHNLDYNEEAVRSVLEEIEDGVLKDHKPEELMETARKEEQERGNCARRRGRR